MTLIDIIEAIQQLQPNFKINIKELTEIINLNLEHKRWDKIEKLKWIEYENLFDYFSSNELLLLSIFQKDTAREPQSDFVENVLMKKLHSLKIYIGIQGNNTYVYKIFKKVDKLLHEKDILLFEYIPENVKKIKAMELTEWKSYNYKSNLKSIDK